MNIQQALQQASHELNKTSPSAHLDAQVLLTHVLRCNTAHLAAWPEKELSEEQLTHFRQLVDGRLNGVPISHLTGEREFWSLVFAVDESTLIPRPETETLVEYVLTKFGNDEALTLLDMGTGTGAIAIAIAHERPNWTVLASDISAQALQLAKKNSDKHHTSNIRFIQSDWFENLPAEKFDIIISNPPYIAADDPHLQQGDVRFEPVRALSSGQAGMDDIEHLCAHAGQHLKKNGWLIIEHGYNQHQQVAGCFAANGFTDIVHQHDLSGHVRMTAGKR